ncbi:ead/Ea22-like family protein [Salmonella enterica subsp. enterica]|nr:ead/Ea22-like family protein [Salmonella enterica subsp. enterica serovar Thompson]ECQ1600728.1 ead/Ea22-like family protein [Salmonella enterica subsp. enterica serovar Thompson]EHK2034391.1 ead/Ea22-like family protein [Salmonella enterica subsp. enterica serovar Thompson]EHK8675842.1 ead/Ea22-like family protein [Salmonella enterica subsp. enterica serovar Thompson]EHK8726897.1 ead/Ea22-like family protein [Salmonella enterica subsp. enterica serovar Thompson]
MSNIDKQALRERYSPKPAPECHICGAEMTIQRISASRITYGCTGATYDDKGCHYAEGRSIADDHYEQSRVTVVDVSDPDALAPLDELEHYKSREERVTKLVLDNSTSWDALYKKLESSEKRIAELVNDEVRQRLANAEHQLHMAELAKCNLRASRKAQFRKRKAAERRIAELEAREIKPAKGEVLVVVSGFTGCGKSAIAGEIEIAMKAIGVPVQWTNGDAEKHMTGADWLTAIEMYKPTVRIVEVNVPRAAGIKVKGE